MEDEFDDEIEVSDYASVLMNLTPDAVISRELLASVLQSTDSEGIPDLDLMVQDVLKAVLKLEEALLASQGKSFYLED